jgi:asparagine synthase (glutamine-hydrolysing)
MTHLIARIARDGTPSFGEAFDRGREALRCFKGITYSDEIATPAAAAAVAPPIRTSDKKIWRSPAGDVWLVDLGLWLPIPARAGLNGSWLISRYLEGGAERLAKELQGIFAIVIGDSRTGETHVITDWCGSLHLFVREDPDACWLSTSSATLGRIGGDPIDPVALHEFVAAGNVYEDRTLWTGVRKLQPGTVFTFSPGGRRERRYWDFASLRAESLDTAEAASAIVEGLAGIVRALPESDRPIVSDLTGGYDTRMLLTALLASGRPFETTVSGPPTLPDVVVSGRVAAALGFPHRPLPPGGPPSAELLLAALRMTDGEYDAFDYARILRVHRELSEHYSISLNGSFGGLARGVWWEVFWPRMGRRIPVDIDLITRKRVASAPSDPSLFQGTAHFSFTDHMSQVAGRAAATAAGMPIGSQLDAIYYYVRAHRWQGRIASATNQLWPSISPFGFAEALEPILSAKVSARFRSLLARELISKYAPKLATIPLEAGYPPCPATLANLHRFAPMVGSYARRAARKIGRKLGVIAQGSTPETSTVLTPREAFAGLFGELPLGDWLGAPLLQDSGFFAPERLAAALDPDRPRRGGDIEQWRRLVTLEMLLRDKRS